MSVPFVVLVLIALVLLAFWRVALLLVLALLLAVFLFGLGFIAEGLETPPSWPSPTEPGGGDG